MELEHHVNGRVETMRLANELTDNASTVVSVVNKAQPRTSFVDNMIDLLWQSFSLSPESGTMFNTEVPIFLEVSNFP